MYVSLLPLYTLVVTFCWFVFVHNLAHFLKTKERRKTSNTKPHNKQASRFFPNLEKKRVNFSSSIVYYPHSYFPLTHFFWLLVSYHNNHWGFFTSFLQFMSTYILLIEHVVVVRLNTELLFGFWEFIDKESERFFSLFILFIFSYFFFSFTRLLFSKRKDRHIDKQRMEKYEENFVF